MYILYFWRVIGEIHLHPGRDLNDYFSCGCQVCKYSSEKMEEGAYQLYKFISSSFTWPLMVGLGILFIPLDDVASVISIPFVIICISVVIAMIGSGYFVGKLMNMYPVESAIVTCCHSGLGGTGDVAILSASGRMGLMPFAQISTRLGGAGTVICATVLLRFFTS